MDYEVWDDAAGTKLESAMSEDKAKAYALEHDPKGERIFLEDANGDQIAWNPNLDPPRWEAI